MARSTGAEWFIYGGVALYALSTASPVGIPLAIVGLGALV